MIKHLNEEVRLRHRALPEDTVLCKHDLQPSSHTVICTLIS